MTVVVGTAGHIDHGKTTLLRALTGIDADRLPEERRRGMTIDVGYAHLTLSDGRSLDFVDVPGHDRLVGNMLVGAGEIDAAMLVVAADDGPRAQTIEHLELLDALDIRSGIAVVTKADLVDADRLAEVVGQVGVLLAGTSLAGSPILAVSAVGDERTGLDRLRGELEQLDRRVRSSIGDLDPREAPVRLAIDRVFSVKGRGAVVTGTLRGGSLARGATLRLVPGDRPARIRDIQVHGVAVEAAGPGRTALNVAGVEIADLGRGLVLTDDPAIIATDRVLARLSRPLPDRARARVHIRTAAVDAALSRSGRDAIELPDGASAGIVPPRVIASCSVGHRARNGSWEESSSTRCRHAGSRVAARRRSAWRRSQPRSVCSNSPHRGAKRTRTSPERDSTFTVRSLGPGTGPTSPPTSPQSSMRRSSVLLRPRAATASPCPLRAPQPSVPSAAQRRSTARQQPERPRPRSIGSPQQASSSATEPWSDRPASPRGSAWTQSSSPRWTVSKRRSPSPRRQY
jgi:small GTP-binding protein